MKLEDIVLFLQKYGEKVDTESYKEARSPTRDIKCAKR